MRNKTIWPLLFILILWAGSAWGADVVAKPGYYKTGTASNCSDLTGWNSGDLEAAWLSTGGNSWCNVCDGTYLGTQIDSDSRLDVPGNNYWIRSVSGATTTILDANATGVYVIYSNSRTGAIIDGLTLTNPNGDGVYFEGDIDANSILRNCIIHNCSDDGIYIANSSVLVQKCVIHDIDHDGIESRGADTPNYVEIDSCSIYDVDNSSTDGDCIAINYGSDYWTIHGSELTHDTENKQVIVCAGSYAKIYDNTLTFLQHCVHFTGGTGHEVFSNLITGTRVTDGTSNPFMVEDTAAWGNCGGKIYNNTVKGTAYRFFYADESEGNAVSWEVYNNSGYISDDGEAVDSTNAIVVITGTPTITYKNNSFQRASASSVYGIYASNAAWTYTGTNNCWYPDGVHYWKGASKTNLADVQDEDGSPETNSITADPLFESTTDFHLQPGSPCIGTGTPIAGVYTGKDGDMRRWESPNGDTMGPYPNKSRYKGYNNINFRISGNPARGANVDNSLIEIDE